MKVAKTTVLNGFWQKNGIDPLGVKVKKTSFFCTLFNYIFWL